MFESVGTFIFFNCPRKLQDMVYIPLFYTTFVKNITPRNTLQDTLEMIAEIHTGLLLCLIIEVRRDWSVFECCNTVEKH